jgi:hypothetical protein
MSSRSHSKVLARRSGRSSLARRMTMRRNIELDEKSQELCNPNTLRVKSQLYQDKEGGCSWGESELWYPWQQVCICPRIAAQFPANVTWNASFPFFCKGLHFRENLHIPFIWSSLAFWARIYQPQGEQLSGCWSRDKNIITEFGRKWRYLPPPNTVICHVHSGTPGRETKWKSLFSSE